MEPQRQVSGGIWVDRVRYTDDAKARAYGLIPVTRLWLPLNGDTLRGYRFKSDELVFLRLESMYAESEFMKCPILCVEHALLDAASADYWYEREKDYGSEETEVIDEDE